MSEPSVFTALADAMFETDDRGRMTGSAPHLYILRTAEAVIVRCHVDVDDYVAAALVGMALRERGRPSEWARDYAAYMRALAPTGAPGSVRAGPVYVFPEALEPVGEVVNLGTANARLLVGGIDEWLADLAREQPMVAALADGRAVSVCASVVKSAAVHGAGVETIARYRGKGYAARAVVGWARSVREAGATPFYATTFDNLPSQRLAARLGLTLAGSEFSVRC